MAKNVTINVRIDTKDGEKSVGSLNNEFKTTLITLRDMEEASTALTEALKDTRVGTEQYEKLRKEIIAVNTEIKNQELAMEALDSEQVASELKSVAGGFTDMAGGMALLSVGNESLEKVVQTMAKVEGATKIVTGGMEAYYSMVKLSSTISLKLAAVSELLGIAKIKQAVATGTATTAQKLLNLAMKASPIFLLIAAITAAVAAIAWFTSSQKSAKEEADLLNTSLDQQIGKMELLAEEANRNAAWQIARGKLLVNEKKIQIEQEIALLELKTKRTKDEDAKILASKAELVKLDINSIKFTAKVQQEGLDREEEYNDKLINLNYERIAAQWAIGKEGNDADKKAALAEIAELELQNETLTSINIGFNGERLNIEKQVVLDITALNNKLALEQAAIAEATLQHNIKIAEAKRAVELKRLQNLKELQNAFLVDKEAVENSFLDSTLSLQDAEENAVRDKYFTLIQLAEQYGEDVTVLEEGLASELAAIQLRSANHAKTLAAETLVLQEQLNMQEELNVAETEEAKLAIRKKYNDRLIQVQTDQLIAQRDAELSNTKLTEEERLKIITATNLEIAQLNEAALESATESWLGQNQIVIDFVMNSITQAVDLIGQMLEEQNARAQASRDLMYGSDTEALKASLANKTITEEEYDQRITDLNQKREQEDLQARRKAFKQQKAMSIVNAIMQTAQAVMAAFSSAAAVPLAGIALGPIMAGVAGALGAVQIGIIASQQFKAARGGVVPGNASGIDSVDAMLAPGEMVINSASAGMFPQLLSDINQAGGGISLAPTLSSPQSKGQTSVFGQQKQEQTVRAIVVESDVTRVQNRVSRIERNSEF